MTNDNPELAMPGDDVTVREFVELKGVVLLLDERLGVFILKHAEDQGEIRDALKAVSAALIKSETTQAAALKSVSDSLTRREVAQRQVKIAVYGSGTSLAVAIITGLFALFS